MIFQQKEKIPAFTENNLLESIVCTNIYKDLLSLCALDSKYFVPNTGIIILSMYFELTTKVTVKAMTRKKAKQGKGRGFEI